MIDPDKNKTPNTSKDEDIEVDIEEYENLFFTASEDELDEQEQIALAIDEALKTFSL